MPLLLLPGFEEDADIVVSEVTMMTGPRWSTHQLSRDAAIPPKGIG
jgi:hypothetical protein